MGKQPPANDPTEELLEGEQGLAPGSLSSGDDRRGVTKSSGDDRKSRTSSGDDR
jgi:hypothetical protein